MLKDFHQRRGIGKRDLLTGKRDLPSGPRGVYKSTPVMLKGYEQLHTHTHTHTHCFTHMYTQACTRQTTRTNTAPWNTNQIPQICMLLNTNKSPLLFIKVPSSSLIARHIFSRVRFIACHTYSYYHIHTIRHVYL